MNHSGVLNTLSKACSCFFFVFFFSISVFLKIFLKYFCAEVSYSLEINCNMADNTLYNVDAVEKRRKYVIMRDTLPAYTRYTSTPPFDGAVIYFAFV